MTNILIGATGSVGVLSIPAYLVKIRESFSNIKVIMTHSASHFISPSALSLIIPEIYTHEFPIDKKNLSHIELAQWADLFIILPASANIISSSAMGLADSLLSSTILSYDKKIVFFPNMNNAMWDNKILQKNVQILKENNHIVVPPIKKEVFEVASKKIEVHGALPSLEVVIAILNKELEFAHG